MPCTSGGELRLAEVRPRRSFTDLLRFQFRKLGYRMVDAIADYREKVESYPVRSEVAEGYLKSCLPSAAPDEAEPLAAILEDVQKHIIPGVTHWQHPSFFA